MSRLERAVRQRRTQLEYLQTEAAHFSSRPVRVKDRWVSADRVESVLNLARFQPPRLLREGSEHVPDPRSVAGSQLRNLAAQLAPQQRPASRPWELHESWVRLDAGRRGAPVWQQDAALPLEAVFDRVVSGDLPLLAVSLLDSDVGFGVPVRRVHWASIDPDTLSPAIALSRREAERAAAVRADELGRVVVVLRQPDGMVRAAALTIPSARTQPRYIRSGAHDWEWTLRWRPTVTGLESIVGLDGVVRLPAQ